MSVSITLKQTNTDVSGAEAPLFRVENEILATEGIDIALFVFSVEPDEYSHPAMPRDVEDYPNSRAEAINLGLDYYRVPSATLEYEDITTAVEAATLIQGRMNYLAAAYQLAKDTFDGATTYVYTEG